MLKSVLMQRASRVPASIDIHAARCFGESSEVYCKIGKYILKLNENSMHETSIVAPFVGHGIKVMRGAHYTFACLCMEIYISTVWMIRAVGSSDHKT